MEVSNQLPEFRFYYFTNLYEETIRFYHEQLGLTIVRSWDRAEHDKGTIFLSPNGHGWLEIEKGDSLPIIQGGLYIQVDDVDQWYEKLKNKSLNFVETISNKSYGHRNFKFSDPSGLNITLFSYLPSK